MPRTSVIGNYSELLTKIPWYPDDLLNDLQTPLAALADIDTRYDIQRERLELGGEAEPVRSQKAAELEHDRRAEREPYIRQLAELHHRMTVLTLQDICNGAADPGR
jgi:hypothetical protein